jgi:putative flippase GtrA
MTKVKTNSANSVTPQKSVAGIFAFQFSINRLRVFTEETQESVLERVLGVTAVSMLVNGNPIDCLAMLVRAVSISLMVLHVDALIKNLAKPNRD